MPVSEWKKLNSEDFKKTLAIKRKFGSNHYVVPEKDVEDKGVLYSKPPPTDFDREGVHLEMTHELDISLFTLDQLVDEIENRGWAVQISRKTDLK